MLVSISKSQALALANGFLDDIGSSKDELRPRETYSELIVLAGEFIEDAQDNLAKNNSIASGGLSDSLVVNEPEQSGDTLKIDISMNFYGLFVNKGVKGTKSGSGIYKFKYDMPSKSMVDAIREWQKEGKAKSTNVNAKKTVTKSEKKNASIAEIDSAFAIARSIKQKGIKGTGFLDKAEISTEQKISDRLGLALKVDVIDSLDI